MNHEILLRLASALAGAAFAAGGAIWQLRRNARDVNGLGRKFWRHVAFDLRAIAEEVESEKGIAKAKLMHLANLIEGK